MGDFTLNISKLDAQFFNVQVDEEIVEDRGRSIQITWEQDEVNGGLELFGYSVRLYPAEPEAKEIV